jgi:Na+:H+ antiporter, NhaA family
MINKDFSSHYPSALEAGVERVVTPFQEFVRNQATTSVLLLLCTFIALSMANSPWAHHYEAFIEMPVGLVVGDQSMTMSVHHWVNDGLMALFFFVLGLEIKREVLVGELKDLQQSLPIIVAASGGMMIPAMIFYACNFGTDNVHGWGIPMATDTAFAVGILGFLGRRIPVAVITFLTALAIIDDLGAIFVIAIFYTDSINLFALSLAGVFLLLLIICNVFGFRNPLIYMLGGAMVWLAMLDSGVHATVAGILVALIVPARPKRTLGWFVSKTRGLVDKFEKIENDTERPILAAEEQHEVAERIQDIAEKATTPLRRWERVLEHPVALLVMPIFALTNAGIPINFVDLATKWGDTLLLGIVVGMVVGKCLGISLFSWLAIQLNLGKLPSGMHMRHVIGVGLVGGIGFTMSIFIAGLSFANDPGALLDAKTGILLASLIAGISGYLWLRKSA